MFHYEQDGKLVHSADESLRLPVADCNNDSVVLHAQGDCRHCDVHVYGLVRRFVPADVRCRAVLETRYPRRRDCQPGRRVCLQLLLDDVCPDAQGRTAGSAVQALFRARQLAGSSVALDRRYCYYAPDQRPDAHRRQPADKAARRGRNNFGITLCVNSSLLIPTQSTIVIMKLYTNITVCFLSLLFAANFALADNLFTPQAIVNLANSDAVPQNVTENIVCTEQATNRIVIYKVGADWNDKSAEVWSWHASESPEIKPEHRVWFNTPDEAKPVLGATHLLMTASGGGVALVRLSDKKTLFYTHVNGNPHSAALLPDGNVASVSSSGFIRLYAVPEHFSDPNVKYTDYPLYGGHGLVWDAKAKLLWGLGYTELVAYEYNFDKESPKLTKVQSYPLRGTPGLGGHDLYPVPGSRLFLLTGNGAAVFDLETKQFTTIWENAGAHTEIYDSKTNDFSSTGESEHKPVVKMTQGPKSLSLTQSGAFIVLAPTQQWYTDTIRYFNKPLTAVGTHTGARYYKARWWIPNAFSDEEN